MQVKAAAKRAAGPVGARFIAHPVPVGQSHPKQGVMMGINKLNQNTRAPVKGCPYHDNAALQAVSGHGRGIPLRVPCRQRFPIYFIHVYSRAPVPVGESPLNRATVQPARFVVANDNLSRRVPTTWHTLLPDKSSFHHHYRAPIALSPHHFYPQICLSYCGMTIPCGRHAHLNGPHRPFSVITETLANT